LACRTKGFKFIDKYSCHCQQVMYFSFLFYMQKSGLSTFHERSEALKSKWHQDGPFWAFGNRTCSMTWVVLWDAWHFAEPALDARWLLKLRVCSVILVY
jgi:hypothetical protein